MFRRLMPLLECQECQVLGLHTERLRHHRVLDPPRFIGQTTTSQIHAQPHDATLIMRSSYLLSNGVGLSHPSAIVMPLWRLARNNNLVDTCVSTHDTWTWSQ
jgi:hypothetical protein